MVSFRNSSAMIISLLLIFLNPFLSSRGAESQFSLPGQSIYRAENSPGISSMGQVSLYVFQGQHAVDHFSVVTEQGEFKTNEEGMLNFSVKAGQWTLFFPSLEYRIEVRIEPELETQILINLTQESKLDSLDLNEPQVVGESKHQVEARPISSSESKYSNPKSVEDNVEEYIVLAPQNRGSIAALIEIRKKSNAVYEVLGSEQISKQGDSDAAASLRRVTGLTLMGGKYVYVRGLGERYSAVQLNGFTLPSPEPARRVVPLDLFPAALLENMMVHKSFSANQPAEFGGGMVSLTTKSVPEKSFNQISLSQSQSDSATYWSYQGGASDWTGHDDGSRALPSTIASVLKSGSRLIEKNESYPDGFTKEELKNLGAQMPKNYSLLEKENEKIPNINLSVGRNWDYGSLKVGTTMALLYNSSTEQEEKYQAGIDSIQIGQYEVTQKNIIEKSEVERKGAALMGLGLNYEDQHRFFATLLSLRHSTDEVSVRESSGSAVNDYSRRQTTTEWVERNMQVQQFKGSHQIPVDTKDKPELSWRWGQAVASRMAPDSKEYVYKKTGLNSPYSLDPEVSGNLRTYGELQDKSAESGIDLAWPVNSQQMGKVQFNLGYSSNVRTRSADTFRLQYIKDYLSGEEPDLTQNPDQIFSINENWILVNQTGSADSYSGEQNILARHVSAEWSPSEQWGISVGTREESSLQRVSTFYYYAPSVPQTEGVIQSYDILPAHSIVWKPNDQVRGRLAYSETLSRPDFRELSSVRYRDDETGYEAMGNNKLKPAIIANLDHRWEYNFSSDEYVSAGLFQKEFTTPIEDVYEPMAGSLLKVPKNAKRALNRGGEFEFRTGLRKLYRGLRRWSLVGNYSVINSEVELDPIESGNLTTKSRPLQGQSPYVYNFQVYYERPALGTSAGLLYNVIGPRITEVGTDTRPDIYEQENTQLDFVASQRWKKSNTVLSFKAKNILDPELTAKQGGIVVRKQKKGQVFTIGLTISI